MRRGGTAGPDRMDRASTISASFMQMSRASAAVQVVPDVLNTDLPEGWRSTDLGNMIRADGLTVVVYGVEWNPMSKACILSSRQAAEELKKRKKKSRVRVRFGCLDEEGEWKRARHENFVIGTPCLFFYFEGKKMRFSHPSVAEASPEQSGAKKGSPLASTAATALPGSQQLSGLPPAVHIRDDMFVGPFSTSMLLALIDSAVDSICTRTKGTDPRPIQVPRFSNVFLVDSEQGNQQVGFQ
ncbi:hypothetical protein DIPPA_64382 [Diplonema papillatum]|nr:hypothetical protein DIPPA_64382 [Diplonema papillatum]